MSFKKEALYNLKSIEPLNSPSDWEIFNLPKLIKTASINKDKTVDLNNFNIEAEIKKHPDHLYLKIFAIKENEVNDNGDAFSPEELKKAAHTFVGVPIFTNHQNDDIEKARGKCVHAWYDREAQGIFIIASVDKIAYPRLARIIEEGYANGTSMGASVDSSCCSLCHNAASTADEYCGHIKEAKNRKRSGKYKCSYHESPSKPSGDCPVCGCKKGETKYHDYNDQKIFEWNYGIKFIENSFVVNPACHSCGVTDILSAPDVTKKIQELKFATEELERRGINKAASNTCSIKKTAGQAELVMLKDSMNNIENVVKSMLSQKEQIDMSYVSDLVKAMADIQESLDELTEMGYGNLPSPNIEAQSLGNMGSNTFSAISQNNVSPQPQPKPVENKPATPNSVGKQDLMNGLGSMTLPKTSNHLNKKKEFVKTSSNITKKLFNIKNIGDNNMITVWASKEDPNSYNVSIDDDFVIEAKGDNILKATNISSLDKEWVDFIQRDPKLAAQEILSTITKESSSTMSKNNPKEAQSNSSQGEVITEKQLNNNPPTRHPRWGSTYETITQDQLNDGSGHALKDTTSESPQVRKGSYETITEDQLNIKSDNHVVRWQEAPEVITEKQWDEWSKRVASELSSDWNSVITEKQLRDLLSKHMLVGAYETITEDQLNNVQMGIARWANKSYVNKLSKLAFEALSDVVAKFDKSPDEIKQVISEIKDDTCKLDKFCKITVINSLPEKQSDVNTIFANASYFSKTANRAAKISSQDALSVAIASNARIGIKVNDVFDAMERILGQAKSLDILNKKVKEKTASVSTTKIDKFAALDDAFASLEGVSLRATFEDVNNVDPSDKTNFLKEVSKLAKSQAGSNFKVASVKVNKKAQVLEALLEEVDDLLSGKMDTLDLPEDFSGVEIEFMSGDDGIDATDAFDVSDDDDAFEPLDDSDFEDISDDSETEDSVGFDDEVSDDELSDDDSVELEGDMDPSDEIEDIKPEFADEDGETKDMSTGYGGGSQTMAKSNKKNVKVAQMMGGEMGGQGGAAQGPGAGATLPQPPDMNANPVESFDDTAGLDDAGDDISDTKQAMPPGSICPVCGSEDVDIIAGKGKCNNCGSEFSYKVTVDVTKWADLTGDQDDGEQEDSLEGEGFEMPENASGSMPEVPVAAMTKIKPEAIRKLAEMKIELGSVSPLTGKTNTFKLPDGSRVCLDTGVKYKVEFAVEKTASKNDKKLAYAQWSWTPKHPKNICPSCSRERARLVRALSEAGISEEQFDLMSVSQKGKKLDELKAAGKIKMQKEASVKAGSVIAEYKKAYGIYGDAFPMDECKEKLARRYGKNAVAMSGPCEGKPLHDCVCKSLKKAGLYTDGLAIKVAEEWEDRDGSEACIESFVRLNKNPMTMRQAAVACSLLKTLVAQNETFLADDLAETYHEEPEVVEDSTTEVGPLDIDEDPFDAEEVNEQVTLTLDKELVEKLDAQLDSALGESLEDIASEPHHSEETIEEISDEPDTLVESHPMTESEVISKAEGLDVDKSMEDGSDCEVEDSHDSEDNEFKSLENKEGESEENSEDTSEENEKIAKQLDFMSKKIGGIGKANGLDYASLAKSLNKKAGEKEVSVELVQDAVENYSAGKPLDGKVVGDMGHEKETIRDAGHPEVPRGEGLMGHEADNIDKTEPLPKIPSDKGTMGHEDEVGLSGGDVRMTGGDQGSGSSEVKESSAREERKILAELASMRGAVNNSKQRINTLADKIATQLDAKKPVSEDKDISPNSNGKTLGKEEKFDAKEPSNTEGSASESLIGHEKETLGEAPKSPKDHPDIPEDNALMGHEDEEIGPEKQTKNKGTVIASKDSGEKSKAQSQKEAFRVAGKLLEAGLIKANQLQVKVAELSNYTPDMIRNYEQSVFAPKVAKKGFDTVSEGLERPLVIAEKQPKGSNETLVSQLQSLFSLDRMNSQAQDLPDFDLRNTFKR